MRRMTTAETAAAATDEKDDAVVEEDIGKKEKLRGKKPERFQTQRAV